MSLPQRIFVFLLCPLIIVLIMLYNAHTASSFYKNISNQVHIEYKAEITSKIDSITAQKGQTVNVELRLVNEGSYIWDNSKGNPVYLSYHLLDKDGKIIKYDNERFAIPGVVPYKYFININPQIKVPDKSGTYILEFDIVREGITWFKDKGSKTLKIILNVK